MGFLDGIVGGPVGGEMATVVNGLIEKYEGLGPTVKSWVGTGANQPITVDQVHQAFGQSSIAEWAATAGLDPQDLAQRLPRILPQAIDKLTPGGVIPKA